MDKKTLQSILSNPFVQSDWQNLLTEVFGVKNFLQKPTEIPLPNNKKAESAFELGSFNTADDRIIGLYLVKVKPEVWLERNKVGLRELLRSVYKYDVDGALIVFEQADKWRLSFVSEIRTFDEEGNITKKVTEPKRYTYLLGKREKTKTPVDRLFSIAGKKLYLEEIRNAFSVEALNEEFYKIVARHFYQLVGATEGKGAKAISYDRVLNLPIGKPSDNASKKVYQEFAVRLIGRTVFCWFLKVKKSDEGISLLPEHLLSSIAVKNYPDYYHSILEKLFFQTLNTPIPERWKELPDGCEQIPFLNGGLFEPQTEDYYKPNITTGFSDYINTLKIHDEWFKDFFENLEQYNFTIDENSVVDIEVSVDPEMLGRIFENLLAEIDPDSGETARKATGSFYTPREIVDYMATESLVLYLHNQTQIDNELLKPIFKIDSEVSFLKPDTEKILEALDRLKILDPACGSGAFPMGVLQKIVMALQKLDRNAEWWKVRQINRIENALLRKQVKEKLELTTVEYARKIGVIQNTLYGVDIQPIAAEISKLRCFLTLVVDENIDESKPNRGVEPLPNLEFKFVTADSLLKLPDDKDFGGLFNAFDDLEKLKQIRLDYLQSYGEQKNELKTEFKLIQKKIASQQLKQGVADVNSRAFLISSWNPFSNEKVDWFDPLWMFGVKEFDIIIGNPPYVSAVSMARSDTQKQLYKKLYPEATGAYDIYILFLLKSIQLSNCCYTWIIPNKFLISEYANKTKQKLINHGLQYSVDVSTFNVFKTASVYPVIILGDNTKKGNSDFKELLLDKYSDIEIERFKLPKKLKEHSTVKDFGLKVGSGATGFEAQKLKRFIQETKTKNSIPFIVSGNIDRYEFRNANVRYMGSKFDQAYISNNGEIADSKWEFWNSPKIVIAGMTKEIEAVWVKTPLALGVGVYAIYDWGIFNPKYLCALLNSRYSSYYLINKFKDKHLAGGYLAINKSTIEQLPLIQCNDETVFCNLVDYIVFLKNIDSSNAINDFVPNSHIVQMFEEVIDVLVYELYFEEDFKKAGIEFMKYAQRDFVSIEGNDEKEAIAIIEKAYQKLREKDNEIRNNLKLMDIKLADLIMPIKTAK